MSCNSLSKGCSLCFACSAPTSCRRFLSPLASLSRLFRHLFWRQRSLLYGHSSGFSACLLLAVAARFTRRDNALINDIARQSARGKQNDQIGRDHQRIETGREPVEGDTGAEQEDRKSDV